MNDIVNVPNRLVTASYKFTLNGMRLKALILSKLSPEDYPNQTDILITVDEWLDAYGGNKNSGLKSLLDGAHSIQTSPIVFEDEPLASYLMFTSCEHSKDAITIRMNRDFLVACVKG